jgi:methionyl-tRNA synthetase
MAKDPNQRDRLKGVIYNICESIRIVAVLLFPFMPETSLKIIRQLGIEYHIETKGLEAISKWGGLKAGVRIKKAEALFPRIEKGEGIKIEKTSNITSQRGKSVTDIKGESNRNGEKIGLREFQKLDMRVGRIISAERIKGSDKLLCLQVDLGERKVQIVSGIAGTYSPDILQGKLCIVIANIMEVEIMGFLSEGMILSAGREGKSYILTVDGDLPPGTRVS